MLLELDVTSSNGKTARIPHFQQNHKFTKDIRNQKIKYQ